MKGFVLFSLLLMIFLAGAISISQSIEPAYAFDFGCSPIEGFAGGPLTCVAVGPIPTGCDFSLAIDDDVVINSPCIPEGGTFNQITYTLFYPSNSGPHVVKFSGGGFYAEATITTLELGDPVGKIPEVVGTVTIIHSDGSQTPAVVNSPIYPGDIIETSAGGGLNILFADNTTFTMVESSRLSVDQFFYNAEEHSGGSFFSFIQGIFVYTSGLIGKTDPENIHIETPVGDLGIRGTEFIWSLDPITGIETIYLIDGKITITPPELGITTEFSAPIIIVYDKSSIISTSPLTQESYNAMKNQIQFKLKSTSEQINLLVDIGNFYGANTKILDNAPKLLSDSNIKNDKGACGKLDAFTNKVNSDKKLPSIQKTQLIQDANLIKVGIGC